MSKVHQPLWRGSLSKFMATWLWLKDGCNPQKATRGNGPPRRNLYGCGSKIGWNPEKGTLGRWQQSLKPAEFPGQTKMIGFPKLWTFMVSSGAGFYPPTVWLLLTIGGFPLQPSKKGFPILRNTQIWIPVPNGSHLAQFGNAWGWDSEVPLLRHAPNCLRPCFGISQTRRKSNTLNLAVVSLFLALSSGLLVSFALLGPHRGIRKVKRSDSGSFSAGHFPT